MPSSCKDIREALAACLQNSDCIMVERHSAADCLRPPLRETLPMKCQQLQRGYSDCKRGMIDMRKRFRGNKPVGSSVELEAGADNPRHQLYGGKPVTGRREEALGTKDAYQAPETRFGESTGTGASTERKDW